jgi:alpha-tubulin suppressor-like RCC1 family protein
VDPSGILQVHELDGIVQKIYAGNDMSLALLTNGSASTFGYNYAGQLGLGGDTTLEQPPAYSPVGIRTVQDIAQVATGSPEEFSHPPGVFPHSFLLTKSGSLFSYGGNDVSIIVTYMFRLVNLGWVM